jgi:catechol 2,3-dioxygenase-like lactoylglutathione lyase family enzyme
MLDHIGLTVTDLARSRAFYEAAFAPLGIAPLVVLTGEYDGVGYGRDGKAAFWIGKAAKGNGPIHVAFMAASRTDVEAFYAAAIAAGGKDNGGPGLRPHYHTDYYGAFVLDPDGNNVEAVCRKPA